MNRIPKAIYDYLLHNPYLCCYGHLAVQAQCTKWEAIDAVNQIVSDGMIDCEAKEKLGSGDYLMRFVCLT